MKWLEELAANARPVSSFNIMEKWKIFQLRKKKLLRKKHRPTTTQVPDQSQLQKMFVKHRATVLARLQRCKPQNTLKRNFETFEAGESDWGTTTESRRWYLKKRRLHGVKAEIILEILAADRYGPDRIFEVDTSVDAMVSAWWQTLCKLSLCPVVSESVCPFEITDSTDEEALRVQENSIESLPNDHTESIECTEEYSEHVAEGFDIRERTDIPDENMPMEQTDSKRLAEFVSGPEVNAAPGFVDKEEHAQYDSLAWAGQTTAERSWSPKDISDHRPQSPACSPAQLTTCQEAQLASASSAECWPEESWVVQADIALISFDRQMSETQSNDQDFLSNIAGGAEQRGKHSQFSTFPGSIRTSTRARQDMISRRSPYTRPVKSLSNPRSKKSEDDTELARCVQNGSGWETSTHVFPPDENSPSGQSTQQTSSTAVKRNGSDEAGKSSPQQAASVHCAERKEALSIDYFHQKIAAGMSIGHAAVCAGFAISKATELVREKACSEKKMEVSSPDDSGYFSDDDDGLQGVFAQADAELRKKKEEAEAQLQKDRVRHMLKPCKSSALKVELDVAEESPPKMLKSKGRKEKRATLQEMRIASTEIERILEIKNSAYSHSRECGTKPCRRSDHRKYVKNCRCSDASRARAILGLGDGIVTPERARKAFHRSLRILACTKGSYHIQARREKAEDEVSKAYDTMHYFQYGKLDVPWLSAPRKSDLEIHAGGPFGRFQKAPSSSHAKTIFERHEEKFAAHRADTVEQILGLQKLLNESKSNWERGRRTRELRELVDQPSSGQLLRDSRDWVKLPRRVVN